MKELEKQTVEQFKELVAQGITVVDAFATWCGPCKMLGPVFTKVAEQTQGMEFVKVDIDQNREVVNDLGVKSVPTLIIFKDGVEVDRKTGYIDEVKLTGWIQEKTK